MFLTIKEFFSTTGPGGECMFEETKVLCQYFLDRGIPGFDLIVYKGGECFLRHMVGYAEVWLYRTIRADLFGEKIQVPIIEEDDKPSLTY